MSQKGNFQVQEIAKVLFIIAAVLLLGMVCSYAVYGYQAHYSILLFLALTMMIVAMVCHDKFRIEH